MAKPAPALSDIAALLTELHGEPVQGLTSLAGGFWSSAYCYRALGRDLVLRLGTIPGAFEGERDACRYNTPDLPIPEVLDVGTALGWDYAVSVRAYGDFLEDVRPEQAEVARPALGRLLRALREAETSGPAHRWHDWLRGNLIDDPGSRTAGWRATLAQDPFLDRIFRQAQERVEELLPTCPQRRDLVHGDLLAGNVLLAPDASKVTAVFSWKCSVIGDFLYDTAWCTFWSAWYPGIEALDAWSVTCADTPPEDLANAAERHHCYELVIGAEHLGWYAWTRDTDNLQRTAEQILTILERGPLDARG